MQRRGFTMVEIMLVIVIMSLMFVMAIPRLREASVKRGVRGSRNTVQGLYSQARVYAMQQSRSTGLRIRGTNKVLVTGYPRTDGGGGYDTIGVVRDLTKEFGVTVQSDADSLISIAANGIRRGSTTVTLTFAKDGYTDSLIIAPYGRITK